MSKWRRAAKVDANQNEIRKELEALGYSVVPGHDDILVGHRGKTYWFEIKTGPKAEVKKSQKKCRADETREQGEDNFEKHMEDTINSDNEKESNHSNNS